MLLLVAGGLMTSFIFNQKSISSLPIRSAASCNRSSVSSKPIRTYPSPNVPNPLPSATMTCAFSRSSSANSLDVYCLGTLNQAKNVPLGALTSQPISRKLLTNTDRKSTRLNSSHVSISYAVFCMKKQKQKTEKQ